MTFAAYRTYVATATMVPTRIAQKPALLDARRQNMPMMKAQNSGTLKGEQHLDVVHDVVEASRDEGRGDADEDADDRDDAAHPEVVRVLAAPADVVLPDVIGEYRVERGHVGGHAGHEGRDEAGDRDSEHTRREIHAHERGD